MPPPTPVPTVTSRRSSTSSPAPKRELAPGRGVGVVLDHHRQVDPLLELGLAGARRARPGWARTAPSSGCRRRSRPRPTPTRRPRAGRAARATRSAMALLDRLGVGRRATRRASCSRMLPCSSTTPAAILVPPTSTPTVSLICLLVSSRPVVERRRRRRGRSARPRRGVRRPPAGCGRQHARPRPASATTPRPPGAALTSGLVCADQRGSPGTPGSSGSPRPPVAMCSLTSWRAPRPPGRERRPAARRRRRRCSLPSPGGRRGAWRPPRRRCRPRPVAVVRRRLVGHGALLRRNRTCSAPSSTRAPATGAGPAPAGSASSRR